MVGVMRKDRMDLEFAKAPGKRHVLRGRNVLIAEEQDLWRTSAWRSA
jgi:hypothetical protein